VRKGEFFFLLFLVWILPSSPAIAETEALFSTGGSIKEKLLKEMESTTSTLDLAIHEITSLDMAQTLVKKPARR
jgi:hypothetical protein